MAFEAERQRTETGMGACNLMGSSGAGGGGGTSGYGGGYSGSDGYFDGGGAVGFPTIDKGVLTSVDVAKQDAWKVCQEVLSERASYVFNYNFSDPGVTAAYEFLHRLHVFLVQEKSWEKVQQTFGVDGGPGCLPRLIDALVAETGPHAVNPAIAAPLKKALSDFLLRVVGDNPLIRDGGDAVAVIAGVDAPVFQRTSNYFLGSFLYECLRAAPGTLSKAARSYLKEFSSAKADQVVASFSGKFRGGEWGGLKQVSYAHLFRVLAGEKDWTAKALRRKMTP